MKIYKTFIYLIILFFPSTSYSIIEVDITRGNLNPLPIAVSPIHSDNDTDNELKKQTNVDNIGTPYRLDFVLTNIISKQYFLKQGIHFYNFPKINM